MYVVVTTSEQLETVGKQYANKSRYSQWHIYGESNAIINDYKLTQTALE